ncbi:MAG: IS256 family transposase [Deltaproteobacteria bacterium]|nr:IS256 family transposase [Deltaproteobacteria bacterium]
MAHQRHGNAFNDAMELLIENGFDGMASVLQILLNEAMKIEREDCLVAGAYQRTPDRKGYANGYKPKTVDTRMGRITVDVPQVRGDIDFYPSALEKGCRSERALKVAIAEMYVKGISTRRVTGVLEKMCGLEISSMQVSRASKMLDEELGKWRNRELGEYPYLILDAHYEKVRINGSVQSCAVFTVIGINTDGKREILGVSVSLSEAEVHWREFLKSLLDRGLHGVQLITSDAHSGLKAARQSLFNGVRWQRCQFHLQQNAQAYVPKKTMQKQVHDDIADVFAGPNGELAQERLKCYVEKYAVSAPQLSEWMEENLPEGLTVFELPQKHRKRMRTSNSLERLHEEINRRTRVARLFPNEASLLRLVSAIEMEISEDWIAGKRYLNMQTEMENENESANSKEKRIYRKNVA